MRVDSVRIPPRTLDELRSQIGEVLQQSNTPGMGLALVARDSVIRVAGLGQADVAAGRAATGRTLFRIGSTSKALTALVALMLREEGKLTLDDPIRRHIPEKAAELKSRHLPVSSNECRTPNDTAAAARERWANAPKKGKMHGQVDLRHDHVPQSSAIVNRSLWASRMNCSRSSIGDVSNQGTAHLAFKGGAVQFRRSVTHVLGQMCYLCTRSVPPCCLTNAEPDGGSCR